MAALTAAEAPASEEAAADLIGDCLAARRTIAIRGGASRNGFGHPVKADRVISTTALSGIVLYEPAEMVIGARAGTPLAEIETALAAQNQILPFEPMDHRPLLGTSGEPTIGGVAAGNISGPRRISAGPARDSLLGVRFINGRGQVIKNGGRVMKNVTGLDLVKLQAGAWGTLGLLTEVIFRVLPKPAASTSLILHGLDDALANRAMSRAMRSPFEVSSAAHLPAGVGTTGARTVLRLEGFPEMLDYRSSRLAAAFADYGEAERIDDATSTALWAEIRDVLPLAEPAERAVWRLSVPPKSGADTVAAIREQVPATALYDWSGGLVWLAVEERAGGDAGQSAIRAAVGRTSGHATLVRGSAELRQRIDVFPPPASGLRQIVAGIKQSFDPEGLFNPGLMYAQG